LTPVKHCRKEIFLHGQIFRAADSAARTCGHTCPKLQNKTAKTIVLVFVGGFTKLLMLRNPHLQDPKTAASEIFMPALTSLPELLSKNPDQAKSFNRNERQARELATRVHLIHVTGPKEVPFDELLSESPHAIPTSEHPQYYSDATRRAEDLLGLARSAYFYAGRACPAFGDLALAFEPSIEAGHKVSVSPIDTGGLVHEMRYIKCALLRMKTPQG
jgi:hypothetical protein